MRAKKQPLTLDADQLATLLGAVRRGYGYTQEKLDTEAKTFAAWTKFAGPQHRGRKLFDALIVAAEKALEEQGKSSTV